ncbi:MAG: alkaline phosphatase family protein [Bryobacteraceae bacterium]|nr:alkaline phosphatase family protein [Bryobacteraceae bacterium]
MSRITLLLLLSSCCFARPLLVLSVDGLDHRYLRDADKLGLKIPNIRKLMREGAWAAGVVGVMPTVTWPSHTSMITGRTPAEHGILGNRRPKTEGGDYYWTADLLRVPTLLNAVRSAGMKSATITWPVTVDAPSDYNLPEYFVRRNGGAMDLESIAKKATPGLVGEISNRYPSFTKQWVDDRSRAQATKYLLETKRPDLMLVHFVDLDSEAHDTGPFTRESNAILEYTDELIGEILRVMPESYTIALVSDHGFEFTEKMVNLRSQLGDVTITPFLLVAKTESEAAKIRELSKKAELGIGREVPLNEVHDLAPMFKDAVAAWEPAGHFAFSPNDSGDGKLHSAPHEKGNHGFWPTRQDYRSVFVMWGSGVKPGRLPELQMTDIAGRLAAVLGLKWPPEKR